MNPIAMFFGLVLLAVSVFFVASPFRSPAFKKKSAGRGIVQQGSLKISLEKQRQAVLLALRDLDFDYQAGKVAEDDYQNLRVNLMNEAAQLMQSQERHKEDSIEALIQSRRQARSAAQPRLQEQQPKLQEQQPNLQEQPVTKGKANDSAAVQAEKRCHHCQAPLPEEAKFCSKCGSPVGETVCPKCKQPLQTGDHFCPGCGTAVNQENKNITPAARPEGE